jgi:hypothetical protein
MSGVVRLCARCGKPYYEGTAGFQPSCSCLNTIPSEPELNNKTVQLQGPYKCPVCEGRGTVPSGFYNQGTWGTWVVSAWGVEMCRSCQGTGVLWRN